MIWKGNYDELTNFVHNINKQHPTIKFDFLISKETVFGHKGSYRQISKYSNHSLQKRDWSSKLLTLKIWTSTLPIEKHSIQPSIRLKRICSTITIFEDESAKHIQKFVEQGYKADDIKEKVSRHVISQEKSFFMKPKATTMSVIYLWQYLKTDLPETSTKSQKNTSLFWR